MFLICLGKLILQLNIITSHFFGCTHFTLEIFRLNNVPFVSILDFDSRYFWAWTDFQSYLDFMLVMWAVGAAVTYLMLPFSWFMETMGFLATFTEAMLGAPQFLRNYKNKSTYGMSIYMVIMWTLGDMFKTSYFILRKAPTQFWVCGLLQVSKTDSVQQTQF